MSQSLSWSLDELDPDAREIARREARRAGMSVEDWLDMVMREGDGRPSRQRAHQAYDEEFEDYRSAAPAPQRFTPSRLNRDEADMLLAKAAANERHVREAEARTAHMLDSITRWMEKAESRIRASERSASDRYERTTSAVADAIKTVGTRLNEVERRSAQERRAYPELRSTPDRRQQPQSRGAGGLSRATLSDAVAAIRARQRDLDGEPMAAARQPEHSGVGREPGPGPDDDFRTMREELRSLAESFTERRAPAASVPADDIRAELLRLRREIARGNGRSNAEINGSLSALISRLDRQGGSGGDRITRTLERLEHDVAKLAAGRGQGGEAIERQIARLHQRLDQIGQKGDGRDLNDVSQEFSAITARLGANLGQRISSLADEIAELRKAQPQAPSDAPHIAELREAVNALQQAGKGEYSGLIAQIDTLTRRIDETPRLSGEELETRLEAMMSRLAGQRDERPAESEDIARRFDALTGKIDGLAESTPDLIGRRLDALQALIESSGQQTSPGLERQIEALAARLENLAASNGLVQVLAKDGKPAYADLRPLEGSLRKIEDRIATFEKADPTPRIVELADRVQLLSERIEAPEAPDLSPIEAMLRDIQDKMERVQAPEEPSGALQALEQQIMALGKRLDDRPAAAGGDAIDATLRELLSAVEGLRNDGVSATERGVRSAMATGLDEIKATQGALENRLHTRFGGIEEQMERIAARLSSLDVTAQQQMPGVAEMLAAATAPAPRRPAARIEPPLMAEKALDAPRQPEQREMPKGLADALVREQPAAAVDAAPALMLGEPLPAREEPPARKAKPQPDIASLVDQPLEPGSGRPRAPRSPDAVMAALSTGEAKVAAGEGKAGGNDPQAIKANYIAAARRAVQAAAAEAKAAATDDKKKPKAGKSNPGAGIKGLIDKRKKPILLGLAAAIVALGSIHVISNVMLKGPELPAQPKVSAAQPERPAAQPRGADQQRSPEQRVQSEQRVQTAQPTQASPLPQTLQPAQVTLPPAPSGLQQPVTPPAQANASAAPAAEAPASAPALGPSPAIAAQTPQPAPANVVASVTGLPEMPANLGTAGLRKAVASGDARAVFDLATRLADGRGVQRDTKLALKLFERAAAAGLVPAQFRIGNMYEKGIGANRDVGLARLWYERAADKGNAKAMHNLAVLYAEGAAGKPDYPMASEWFRKAAEHGVRDSQFNLAILLARGLGAAQDLSQSYTWFAIAAAQGDEEAGKKREEVALQMPAAELAAAKQAVERWKAKPLDPAANEVQLPAKGWDEPVAQPAPQKKTPRNTQA